MVSPLGTRSTDLSACAGLIWLLEGATVTRGCRDSVSARCRRTDTAVREGTGRSFTRRCAALAPGDQPTRSDQEREERTSPDQRLHGVPRWPSSQAPKRQKTVLYGGNSQSSM